MSSRAHHPATNQYPALHCLIRSVGDSPACALNAHDSALAQP
jgi:hypothetical protein